MKSFTKIKKCKITNCYNQYQCWLDTYDWCLAQDRSSIRAWRCWCLGSGRSYVRRRANTALVWPPYAPALVAPSTRLLSAVSLRQCPVSWTSTPRPDDQFPRYPLTLPISKYVWKCAYFFQWDKQQNNFCSLITDHIMNKICKLLLMELIILNFELKLLFIKL